VSHMLIFVLLLCPVPSRSSPVPASYFTELRNGSSSEWSTDQVWIFRRRMNTGSVTNTASSNFLMMTSLTMSTSYRLGWSLTLRCVVTVLTDVSWVPAHSGSGSLPGLFDPDYETSKRRQSPNDTAYLYNRDGVCLLRGTDWSFK